MVVHSPSTFPMFQKSVTDLRTGMFPAFGSKPRRLASGGGALMLTAKDPEKRKAGWELMKHMVSLESMTIWTAATGYIFPFDPAKVDIPMTDPRQKPVYEQLPGAVQWANWPGEYGLEAEKIFLDYMDGILFEGKDAEANLNQAAKEINKILAGS